MSMSYSRLCFRRSSSCEKQDIACQRRRATLFEAVCLHRVRLSVRGAHVSCPLKYRGREKNAAIPTSNSTLASPQLRKMMYLRNDVTRTQAGILLPKRLLTSNTTRRPTGKNTRAKSGKMPMTFDSRLPVLSMGRPTFSFSHLARNCASPSPCLFSRPMNLSLCAKSTL